MPEKLEQLPVFISDLNNSKISDNAKLASSIEYFLQNRLSTPVISASISPDFLSFHIDLKKELDLTFNRCLLFLVRSVSTDNPQIISQLLDDMRVACQKEGLADMPCLIFYLGQDSEITDYITDTFTNSFISDAHGLQNLLSESEPRKKILEHLKTKGITMALCPFNYLGPCRPEMFVGRENLINEILYSQHNAYAITGGRRIGKTSLLFKLQEKEQNTKRVNPYHPLYIDCCNLSSFDALAWEITRKIDPTSYYRDKTKRPLSFDQILARGFHGKRLLLLLDEMDPLIESAKNDKKGMLPFYNLIRDVTNKDRMKLVITGFNQVFNMIHDSKHPFYNLCETKHLDVLKYQDVRKLITIPLVRLGLGLEPKNEIISKLYNFTAGHPSATQFFAKKLFEKRRGTKITIHDLNNVVRGEDLINFTLDFFIMNTMPLDKYICYLSMENESVSQDDVLKSIDNQEISITAKSDQIYLSLRSLIFNNIFAFDHEQNSYSFLYPAMKKVLKRYLFSPVYIKSLEKEVRHA
jgi:hypothetical protein